MKKTLLALLFGLAGYAHAVTATPTVTPTNTPTPTFTPTPVAQYDPAMYREFIYPQSIFANDGVVLASAVTTPLPGDAAPWVAQSVSATAFVMSTGSAKVRFSYGVPGNYLARPNTPNMNVWVYCNTTATANAMTVTMNVARNPMNNLLPSGGTVYVGTATSITTALAGSSTAGKFLRVKMPMPSTARFQQGDHLSFDLQRSGGVTTDLYVYRVEIEYVPQPYHEH